MKMASTLSDDTAPSASLDHLEAQAAPTHPRAPPEQLGGSPWPQQPASGRPKVEESPLSSTRYGEQPYDGARGYVLRKKPPGKLLPKAHMVEREHRVRRARLVQDRSGESAHVLAQVAKASRFNYFFAIRAMLFYVAIVRVVMANTFGAFALRMHYLIPKRIGKPPRTSCSQTMFAPMIN